MLTTPVKPTAAHRLVIVGGGIAGLSAAWYARQQDADVQITVLEACERWGGKVYTEHVNTKGDTPLILEMGADAFLTRKPWALALARELGLDERIQGVNTNNSRTFVLHGGRLTPLPQGLQLLVPTQLLPFLRSPLFSWRGKLLVLLERFVPRREGHGDETLANFVRRRLGAEALDKLGEPLLAGVYNAEPERQSMQATFPQFPALEQKYGSLMRGSRAAQAERKAAPATEPPFISFKTGAHELVDALVDKLDADLRLNTAVESVERRSGGDYRLALTSGEMLEADAVIFATPANVTAKLLRQAAPQAAAHLSKIRYAGIGTCYLSFRRSDVPHALDGFGVVIPSSEERQIDGMTWTSSKWDGRAPDDEVLLRLFFGGPHTRDMLDLNDSDLLAVVREEIRQILRIEAPPLYQRVFRWREGYPQYDVGHLERVTAIEATLPPGLFVTGSSYRGVGVPDCIKQGQAAAQQAVEFLAERDTAAFETQELLR
ncbi:MAG: protoporphyrinogen oxidase [Anaerolineae bacterium]|nr:protoporphyrinogen oxidase [Anaerolineae bacterium]